MTQTSQPLWIQDRGIVIAQSQDAEWRCGDAPDYTSTNTFLNYATDTSSTSLK
ncbi:hypothetical protein [Dulcicalothrix desertica]|uniref:hypothetical protein n=1 Tax=Dulcicalothrix desertica TaxID=32056 RepID=UPI00119C1F37|nr:hypothetical protein [Dulcicalothrix desertica]TWH44191.1 hypothetical protein CAL7102_07975 [Dulcicalothrix desertica PCC 7102]